MLSITPIKNSAQAASYYEADNYYAKDSHEAKEASHWWGKGAELLNLEGFIEPEQFQKLLEGVLPNGQELGRLGNTQKEHRPGYDLTFSAPKSVSILSEVGNDKRIHSAHDKAVNEALSYLEAHAAQTRRSQEGCITFEKTDNLMVAKFRHDTSREQDPQLHTHCVVINATKRADNQWRSLSSEELFENKMLAGLMYRSVLAHELQTLGYEIIKTHIDGRFEVNHVPQNIIQAFSKRREEIKQVMAERGFEGAKAAEVATLITRQNKQMIDRNTLHRQWKTTCQENNFDVSQAINNSLGKEKFLHHSLSEKIADKAVHYACAHLSEREALFSHQEILKVALAYGIGTTLSQHIESSIKKSQKNNQLISVVRESTDKSLWTTPEALKLEKDTLNQMLDGRFSVKPISSIEKVEHFLSGDSHLNTSQKEAITMTLTTLDRMVGIQGYAGTGKTTMLSALKTFAEKQGFEIKGIAPSATAANQLLEGAGIISTTLDMYLIDHAKQGGFIKSCSKTVFILDESSMASTSKMNELLTSIHQNRGRLLLMGDTQQLGAIEAGKPFYQLQKAGMETAVMQNIQRQKNPELKQAVYDAIRGDIKSALNKIGDKMYEITNKEKRLEQLAHDYLLLSTEQRQNTLVLTPANEDRIIVNQYIRKGLKQEASLTGKTTSATVLVNRDLSQAERTLAVNYNIGDVIRFNKNYSSMNIKKGTYLEVAAIDTENNKMILKSDNHSIEWCPHQIRGNRKGAIEVYHHEHRELQVGEFIRWQRNDRSQEIYNSDTGKIINIKQNTATFELANGKITEVNFENKHHQHWDYAYATTIHAAQGKTCDIVLAHGESFRKNLTNQHGFYVTISRAKHEVRLYTDNKEDYLKTLTKYIGDKTSALNTQIHEPTFKGTGNIPEKNKEIIL